MRRASKTSRSSSSSRSQVRLTVLGSGTSSGVPLIGCRCPVCRSKNPRNQRMRASVWFEIETPKGRRSLLVDTSPDFRAQALRFKIDRVDAVLYTHPHSDHVSGIDDLRAYNFLQNESIPLYGHDWTMRELRLKFDYIFSGAKSEGGGIPRLTLHEFEPAVPTFEVCGVTVTPLQAPHGSRTTVGYRVGSVAYITDCHLIPESTLERMQGLDALVLDCVRLKPHSTHLHLDAALEIVRRVKPKKTWLCHLGHEFDDRIYNGDQTPLPRGVKLAWDGVRILGKID